MMTSSRPYLIRALYEWILDNGGVPHLLVDAEADSVIVPQEFVEDGRIILDLSPEAVRDLVINNQTVEFRGRFAEIIRHVSLPTASVMAIYNEEGIGMFFEDSEFDDGMEDGGETDLELPSYPASLSSTNQPKKPKKPRPPHLKIVK